jgi:hypothetical protein
MATEPTREQAVRDGLALMCMALRQEVDAPQRRVYVRGLADVPADVIEAGADRLVTEPGRRFFPTLPEWIGACAAVIDERRKWAARVALQIRNECPVCHGSGFQDIEGPNQVTQCSCVKQAAELMANAPTAIRPMLTSGDEPPEAA